MVGLALVAACASGPVSAADWRFAPNASLGFAATSNPRFLPQGGEDEQLRLADLGAELTVATETLDLSFVPRLSFERARGSSESDRDNDYQFLSAKSTLRRERSRWIAALDWAHDSTRISELGTTGLVQQDYRREFLAVSAGPSWSLSEKVAVGASAQWSDTDYRDAEASGLVDSVRTSVSSFVSSSITERSTFTLSVRGGLLESDRPGGRTRDASLSVGFRHELSPRWQLELAAGPAVAESGANTTNGRLFTAGLSHGGEVTRFSVGASRRLDPLGTGFLAVVEQVTAAVEQHRSEQLTLSLGASASRNRTLFDAAVSEDQETRYYQLSGSARWRLAESWSLWLDLAARLQETRNLTTASAESFRAYLGIAWRGRMASL